MSRQNVLHESDNLVTLNFIFTKAYIENYFENEEDETAAQILKANVAEVPRWDFNLVVKNMLAVALTKHLDFMTLLKSSN
ncbi:hypothetical protein FBU30_003349 [Linnemannia zychae]|nr:hypothetical protein FBU30_003349 [Linnemannia zychae]